MKYFILPAFTDFRHATNYSNKRNLACVLLRTMFPCFGLGFEQLRPVPAGSLLKEERQENDTNGFG